MFSLYKTGSHLELSVLEVRFSVDASGANVMTQAINTSFTSAQIIGIFLDSDHRKLPGLRTAAPKPVKETLTAGATEPGNVKRS